MEGVELYDEHGQLIDLYGTSKPQHNSPDFEEGQNGIILSKCHSAPMKEDESNPDTALCSHCDEPAATRNPKGGWNALVSSEA
jgi:hypothetical protein